MLLIRQALAAHLTYRDGDHRAAFDVGWCRGATECLDLYMAMAPKGTGVLRGCAAPTTIT
jgi:hypothetical protein